MDGMGRETLGIITISTSLLIDFHGIKRRLRMRLM